ncbi:hypothetical protein [Devosia sp. MC1541]|uniref:hypothetical protein n=1 Tax=Devosia sp. MC1541 TaxID=2725264 RepID=UPI00145FC5E5|nr:hypothetical protein [Devosia sp. MC1541]
MIRMGGDAARRAAAQALSSYLEHNDPKSFDRRVDAALSIFSQIWPKELTLSSREVSQELVRLAGVSGRRYPEVAQKILRYLSPFDCWSMLEYRLYEGQEIDERFKVISTKESAVALLAVLDKTVGESEDAVIPYDLAEALKHIATIAPNTRGDSRYLRLETLGRRQ